MNENRKKLNVFIPICAFFLFLSVTPWLILFTSGKPFNQKMEDPSIINGIITASSVIYAFTLTGLARYRGRAGILLDTLLATSTLLMLYSGAFYFSHCVRFGYATLEVLTWATTSLFWNFGMWFSVATMKSFGQETKRKGSE